MIKVLVVDDEDIIRQRLCNLLKMDDYETFQACEGAEAFEAFQKERPQVVLTDIKMPKMDGIILLDKIKAISSDTEVIMVTGHGGTETAIQALRKGAFDYLTKPINYDELEISIKRAMEKRNLIQKEQKLVEALKDACAAEKEKSLELEKALFELKQMQSMLIQAGKLSAMGQLTAGVAHELNQPLTVIRGHSQILAKNFEEDNVNRDLFMKIVEQTSRMKKIILNLKTFARASSFHYCDIDINMCLRESLLLFQSQLRVHNIEVIIELAPDLPKIYGDFNQLQQVFTNFISNARDALDEKEKGTKMFRISSQLIKDEKDNEDEIEIIFQDSGVGIAKDIQNEIFNPFFTTKPEGKGTGLGLSISYGIIENHAGGIKLLSEKDNGSVFKIIIPVAGTRRSKLVGKKDYGEDFNS